MEVSGVGGVRCTPWTRGPTRWGWCWWYVRGTRQRGAGEAGTDPHRPGQRGRGEGEAPIGAYCYVSAAVEQAVALSLTLVLAEGAERGDRGGRGIRTAVSGYLKEQALEAYQPSLSPEKGYRVTMPASAPPSWTRTGWRTTRG